MMSSKPQLTLFLALAACSLLLLSFSWNGSSSYLSPKALSALSALSLSSTHPLNVSCSCSCNCPSRSNEEGEWPTQTQASSTSKCTLSSAFPPGTCTQTKRPLTTELTAKLDRWYSDLRAHSSAMGASLAKLSKEYSQGEECLLLDIGANVGSVARFVLEASDCRVMSFEAIPWYAEFAQQKMNQFPKLASRWQIFANGLSDADGTLEFLISTNDNFGWNTIAEEKKSGNQEKICVGARSFDSWLEFTGLVIPQVSAIKIDTEGAEGHVLHGMRGFLARLDPKPVLVIEIAWGPTSPFWKKVTEELEYLFSIGYQRFDYNQIQSTTDYVISPTKSGKLN